jgi:hypothetical protein
LLGKSAFHPPDRSCLHCTTAARLNRNFTIGVTYAVGDILHDLGYAQELGIFATVKF